MIRRRFALLALGISAAAARGLAAQKADSSGAPAPGPKVTLKPSGYLQARVRF